MRWPSSIETTATPIECGGPRSAWRERPTATIERRSGTARMAASRSLPISDHRPSGRPCAHRSRYTVSSSRWRPGCQTNDTAAGGQLYDYRRSWCWGRDTLLGVRGGTHHGSRRVADRIERRPGAAVRQGDTTLLRFDAGPVWVAGCRVHTLRPHSPFEGFRLAVLAAGPPLNGPININSPARLVMSASFCRGRPGPPVPPVPSTRRRARRAKIPISSCSTGSAIQDVSIISKLVGEAGAARVPRYLAERVLSGPIRHACNGVEAQRIVH